MSRRRANTKMNKQSNVFQLNQALYENGKAQLEGPAKKRWTKHDLNHIQPLNHPQREMVEQFLNGQHICADGSAGTGKTFLSVYLALNELLNPSNDIEKIIIVRSAVASREIGHLPGTLEEKSMVYELPYTDMFSHFLGHANSYNDMKNANYVQFCTTSFIRGLTWDNAVVIVDEYQNMTLSEIDSIMTRMGNNSRILLCGDTKYQCDLSRGEKTGCNALISMVEKMSGFSRISFTRNDIVRSSFCREWIIAREDVS